MEWSIPITIESPAGTLVLNQAASNVYRLTPEDCSGLDGAPLRVTQNNVPQGDGGLIHTTFRAAREITLAGILSLEDPSLTTDSAYVQARSAMEEGLIEVCESLENADGVLYFTKTGSGVQRNYIVRCDHPVDISGSWQKRFVFGLVAANPNATLS
jgi:hypothetical protein